ncbi:hypothetical protein SBP02_13960 [Pseudomonas benzenivorans]|uniref:Uncharacterized protein n=1 Tax=Pseudomonas benzenivorans TaxID=556533 RepID=A0ABZ0PRU3_9PSED|nr:hypothetical protein [Pseudomonas benzenivorans]WPC03882.1 hypothetical protein SBP02_13960 [Pseudomonas benzenivorans]
MRRVFFACLSVALLAGAIYSCEFQARMSAAKLQPVYPIASFGDVFRNF